MCNHAAVSGRCDWENKACLCEQQGTNTANKGCVAATWHPFTEYIHSQIGHEGLQWVDDPYHWFIKGDKALPPHSPSQRAGWWGYASQRAGPWRYGDHLPTQPPNLRIEGRTWDGNANGLKRGFENRRQWTADDYGGNDLERGSGNLRAGWGGWWGQPSGNLKVGFRPNKPLSWWSGKACNSATGETDSHPDNLVTCSQWCNVAHGYTGGYCSSSYCYCITPA